MYYFPQKQCICQARLNESIGMKCRNLGTLRSMLLGCIVLAGCILVVFYMPVSTYIQHSYSFLSSLNFKTSGMKILSWTSEDNLPVYNFGSSTKQRLSDLRVINETVKERLVEISEIVKVAGVNCSALFNGSQKENATMTTATKNLDPPINDRSYPNLTADCQHFIASRGYIMSSLTQEEEDFPLAYSIIAMKDAEMVERLLRAIYRPQNYYCINADKKAPNDFFSALSGIASCFPNVFLLNPRVDVKWGTFTVLEPELLCMKELWKYPKWKYFINLTGQEFPLKTNYELVKILTAYRGASDVLTYLNCIKRFQWRWNNTVAPYGLRMVIGSVHITANRYMRIDDYTGYINESYGGSCSLYKPAVIPTREGKVANIWTMAISPQLRLKVFVDYMLHNETAQGLLNWVKTTHLSDETFFAILNANPHLGIKGTYTGKLDSCNFTRPFVTRYKMWPGYPCAGRRVREVCILTSGDLIRLSNATELFANKFYLNDDRICIGCLEEKIFNDTRDGYLGVKTFNMSYYSNLDFVKNQIE